MTGGAMQGVEEEVLEPCQRRVGRLSRREICHEVPQILREQEDHGAGHPS